MDSQLDEKVMLRCGLSIPNRIAVAPLTNTQSNSDGTLHEDEYNWLVRRAGSFGLVTTCAAFISSEGKAWDGQLGVAGEEHLDGLSRLTQGIRDKGSVAMMQLHHAGNKASMAPQKISTVDTGEIRGANIEDIARIRDDFVNAALLAEKAGFDGVEIHGANGYIFTQFLSPMDNPRKDQYGGSIENRARFLRETVQAVRKATSPGFMLCVRISPVDTWDQRGLLLDDSIKVCQWLAEDGADIIHLSLRDASGPAPFEDNDTPVVRAIRDNVQDEVKIAVAGGIWTREDAQRAEKAGADIIMLGRAAMAHPDWSSESLQEDFTPVQPPWDPEYLKKQQLSPKFLKYISRMLQD